MIYSKLLIAATLVGSANADCIRSTQAGYVISADPSVLTSGAGWDAAGWAGTCAAGYSGTAVAPTVCTTDPGEYVLSGCTPCSAGKFNAAAGNGVTCADWTAVAAGGTTTCTANKLDTTARWAGTTTADATCAACTGSTDFGPADGSTDCVAVTTCGNTASTTTTARATTTAATATADTVCADCATNFWAATGADDCAAVTVCGDQADGTTRTTTTDATPTADAVCEACADGSWGANAGDCTAWSTCGNQVALSSCGEAVIRTTTSQTATADTVCEDCAAGTWAAGTGDCATWTVCGIATGTTARAETQAPSLVLDRTCAACADGFWAETPADNCAADTAACGNQVTGTGSGSPRTATSATDTEDIKCANCNTGSYPSSALGVCVLCTEVVGATAPAIVTCTSATDSRLGAATCATGTIKKTLGSDAVTGPPAVPGTMDTCTAACGTGMWDNSNTCTACDAVAGAADDATYTCQPTSGDASRVSACAEGKWKTVGTDISTDDTCTNGCAAGLFYNDDMICTPCTAVTKEVADATYTCTTDSDTRVSGCLAAHFKTVGACGSTDTCTACNAVTGSLAGTALSCTSLLTSRVVACAASGTTKKNGAANGAIADTCLTACPTGSWDNSNVCTGCAAINNKATSATVTCTSASTSQLVGACATGFYKTAATADTCNACTAINNKATTATVTCTTNADSRIDACAAGFFKTAGGAGAHDTCTACTAVADSQSVTCTAADASTPVCNNGFYTTGNTCTACTVIANAGTSPTYTCTTASNTRFASVYCKTGFYYTLNSCADSAGTCTACTVVAGALEAATYTCNNAMNSRVSACAGTSTTAKTIGSTDTMDTCTATCAPGMWDSSNVCTACQTVANAAADATYTCTSNSDSRVSACASNAFKTVGADGATDVCTPCTTVAGKAAGSDGAITCTSASDSRVANCIAGKFKTVGAAGATDVCTACTAVADSQSVTCTAADASTPVCNNGFYTTGNTCTDCVDIANAGTNPTYTCTTATNTKFASVNCKTGFFKTESAACADDADTCTACTAITNALSTAALTCTTAANSEFGTAAGDKCEPTYYKVSAAGTVLADSCALIMTAACGNQLAVGTAAAVIRGNTAAVAGVTNKICNACTANTVAATGADNCAACTTVAGAAAGATYTCSTATDSRVCACATATSKKTIGATGVMDTCTATCAPGTWDNAGTCQSCAPVTNAAADATYTCTSNSDSRVSACQAQDECTGNSDTYLKTVGTATNMDTCTTSCPTGTYNNAGICTACTYITGAGDQGGKDFTCTTATDTHVTDCGTEGPTTKHWAGLVASTDPAVVGTMDTCTSCCGTGYWDNNNECTAVKVCGAGRSTGNVAATPTADATCGACDAGTWASADTEDCVAHSTCGNQLAPLPCGGVDPRGVHEHGDATTDTACNNCDSGTWNAAHGDCVAVTVCGDQADGTTRSTTIAATPTADAICQACDNGSWGANAGDCSACTAVSGAAAGATLTCASAMASRISECDSCSAPNKFTGATASVDPVVVGTMDTCSATCAAGLFEIGVIACSATNPTYNFNNVCYLCSPVANAATVTCTAFTSFFGATNSVATSCNTGFDLVSGACTPTPTPGVTTAAATTAAPEPGTATPSGTPAVASATSSTVASFVVMVAVVVASLMH